jgi:colanic acid biosynthesis glycosyl transferase WcaI
MHGTVFAPMDQPESPHHQQGAARPKLLFVSQLFDPEPNFKGLKFAKSLQARGFDVEVVTGFPNYPGGKIYAGYKVRPWQREIMDGVPVMRLALYPSHDNSAVRRAMNYISFFLSATLYLIFFARRADVAYVYHPPLTVGLAAAVARVFRRTPTVIDIQDLWPDTLRATGMLNNERILSLIGWSCKWLYRQVDHIVVLSPGFVRKLRERGVDAAKITKIYNWADESGLTSDSPTQAPEAFREPGRFRLLFAGNMGRAQGLDAVLDAAKIVATSAPEVEFCFMGGGVDQARLKHRVDAEQISNVRFLPKVSMVEATAFLTAADALLVHLTSDPLFEITIPSKTQAYMAAGRPIIMGVAGDAADLVQQAGGGVVVQPENAKDIAAAVLRLSQMPSPEREKMAQANRLFYREHLSMDKGVTAFVEVFEKLISKR